MIFSGQAVVKLKKKMGHDFFENPECRYFPCHQGDIEDFNCLFCFCPMYHIECLGEPGYIEIKGKLVKDCSRCLYPHRPENYETIIEYLRLLLVEEI